MFVLFVSHECETWSVTLRV